MENSQNQENSGKPLAPLEEPKTEQLNAQAVCLPTTPIVLVPIQLEKELENDERLGFKEQVAIVRAGFSKGVHYDGCTAVPDFDFGADCCGEHDYHYQVGDISRQEADCKLRACLRAKGYFVLPWLYWAGVRTFAGGVWKNYRNKNEDIVSDAGPTGSDRL